MPKSEVKEEIPIPGIELSINGIFRHHVYDNPLINDSDVYPQLHANMNDWDHISQQTALPYLPQQQQQEPIKVTLGIKPLETISLSACDSINLGKYIFYLKKILYMRKSTASVFFPY
jgi:hypothetical protein